MNAMSEDREFGIRWKEFQMRAWPVMECGAPCRKCNYHLPDSPHGSCGCPLRCDAQMMIQFKE